MGAEDDAWTPDVFLLPSKRKMSKIRNDGIERERERKRGQKEKRESEGDVKQVSQ